MRTVLVLLCGLALLGAAGCATQGGVQVAGPASQVSPPPPPPTVPSGTPASADPIAILRADPQINEKIKGELVPCVGGSYPIEDRYADLTHDGTAELLVTVRRCPSLAAEGGPEVAPPGLRYIGGYAAYVYSLATDPPTRLFGAEDSAVEMLAPKDANGELIVFHDRWTSQDDPCCPTDNITLLYRWDGTKFVEVAR